MLHRERISLRLLFSSTSLYLIMEGPYSEVAKDREEGNIVDHNPEAADHRSEVSDHNTKAADNRPEAADHNTKAADHNTPEHNDCLPADGCLTASRFPESVSVGISPKKRENKASMLTPYTCRYPVMAAISRPFSLHIFFVQSIDPST